MAGNVSGAQQHAEQTSTGTGRTVSPRGAPSRAEDVRVGRSGGASAYFWENAGRSTGTSAAGRGVGVTPSSAERTYGLRIEDGPRMRRETADTVAELIRSARTSGASAMAVKFAVGAEIAATPAVGRLLDQPHERVEAAPLATALRAAPRLDDARVESISRELAELAAQHGRAPVDDTRCTIAVAPAGTGWTRTFWSPPATETVLEQGRADGAGGHVRLVAVHGVQVGEGNEQLTVVTHEVDDPRIDYRSLMADTVVSRALAALAAAPGDPGRRAAAVTALGRCADHAGDWTEAYAGDATATRGPGGAGLDGTVAIVRSRQVQVGDHSYLETRVVHTVSPTIAAAALLHDPAVVQSLLDVVTQPVGAASRRRFEQVTAAALRADLASSAPAQSGYGTVHKPPSAGSTLVLTGAVGQSVGHRARAKARLAQDVHLRRRARGGTARVSRLTQRAGRKLARRLPPAAPGHTG